MYRIKRSRKTSGNSRVEFTYRTTEKQRMKNNLLGILVLILIIIFACDLGGCTSWLGHMIGK
ncbi:MAG: hypothetical protein PHT79_05460 [Syntrophomonadaceae bacterium]|nr:hypothetical protein [Syntrophomonadaceae bacterium]MDD3888440.1 hypothetical protein [Syntrophomonadaceae bacterium]MDD4549192.1 hypothetical protein [Syntrophomonadaceae bacterium]